MKGIVNLTPHSITVMSDEWEKIFFPSGQVLRLEEKEELMYTNENGVQFVRKTYNLPDMSFVQADKTYIVSLILIPYLTGIAGDFIAPDTGVKSVVRDGEGKIIGVRGFIVP